MNSWPWKALAEDLEHEHGPYADYAAWEKWMLTQMDRDCCGEGVGCKQAGDKSDCYACTMALWWEKMDIWQKTCLYTIMSAILSWGDSPAGEGGTDG